MPPDTFPQRQPETPEGTVACKLRVECPCLSTEFGKWAIKLCIASAWLTGVTSSGITHGCFCPKEASHWTPWWDVGDFRSFVHSKVESQHGEQILAFYRKYINPLHTADKVTAFFPQGARFAVSREKVHKRPKSDYERLLTVLSNDEDSYAGYFMEWLWSELFLGPKQPCVIPEEVTPVSHAEAMQSLIAHFPNSVERHGHSTRSLQATVPSGVSGCLCGKVSGGISGGISAYKASVLDI
jgi:hypothetical protein